MNVGGAEIERSIEDDTSIWGLLTPIGRQPNLVFI